MKDEFVQLACDYKDHYIEYRYMSEKLDGMRCIWDGVSVGIPCADVPWSRVKEGVSTGLWSRYNTPIEAPLDWVRQLPVGVPLDGELYDPSIPFGELMSRIRVGPWTNIAYNVFEKLPITFFNVRLINHRIGRNEYTVFIPPRARQWFIDHGGIEIPNTPFGSRRPQDLTSPCVLVKQTQVRSMDEVDVAMVGFREGAILRTDSPYCTYRTSELIKVKHAHDAEGTVVGFNPGKGRLEGKVGSLVIECDTGVIFDLSGMTDAQRDYGAIPIGSVVTFTYRELTSDGKPREARFKGVRDAS